MLAELFQRTAELLRENRKFALLHLVRVKGSSPGKQGFKMLVAKDGEKLGTIGGGDAELQMIAQAHAAMTEGKSRSVNYELTIRPGNLVRSMCGGVNEVWIEVFMPKPCLLLLGGGNCAREVAKLCRQLDFPYVVLDDRPEFACTEDFPGALEVCCCRADAYLQREGIPRFSHILGLGYNAAFDLDGLIPAILELPENVFLGAIGSRPKYARMGDLAAERGVPTEVWKRRIKCPVGLPIGAQTPAEIALSIMAEVVSLLPDRESHSWPREEIEAALPEETDAGLGPE